ncbi:MAG TPA: VWA-like domain-containing protein [Acidimicrobiales bacterium]|nr:VWA-like domain-containing protein [Acidimicrobiales bacterium]
MTSTAHSDGLDQRKLSASRLFATSRYPYLASALFAAPVRCVPGSGTIAVDRGWRIHADPEVVNALPADEVGRILIHLVSHLLRDHTDRAVRADVTSDGGDPIAWNRASDAEINDDLASNGMVPECAAEMPGGLGAPEGRLAEQYYDLARGGKRQWDCGSGCDGMARPWDGDARQNDGLTDRDGQFLRLATASEMQRHEAAEPGSVATGWMRWAEQMLPSRTDWRRVLAAEVQTGVMRVAGMVDYTYRRPSRRSEVAPSVIMPILERPVPDVAIVCDTSGSMTSDLLARALAEVESILQRVGLRGTNVRVLACDAEVHSVKRVSRASQVELLGGGGTDMGEGIARALALRPRPSIVVVLTDGYTPWPESAPRGAKVIVGLLDAPGGAAHGFAPWAQGAPMPPTWARAVRITEFATT